MAEPVRNSRQDRSYSGNAASGNSRQQNGDQHHRYEGVGAVYHGDVQKLGTPIGRGSILSPTRWISTRENGEALIDAARQGQVERMRRLLANKYTDLDFMDKQKTTPLLAAIQGKHCAAVKLLLREGANPGLRYSSAHETPLILAAKLDYHDVIQALLQHNAAMDGVQTVWDRGKEVHLSFTSMIHQHLIDAASQGEIDRIDELLSKQYVNVNFIDDDERVTALWAAVEKGQPAAATVLLEKGALPDLRHDRFRSKPHRPLMLAISNCDADIFRILLRHGAALERFVIGETVVGYPIQYGRSLSRAFVDGPIDILQTQIFDAHPTMVLDLLQHGIPVQKAALLPALWSLREENVELIRVLIHSGADVEARDGQG